MCQESKEVQFMPPHSRDRAWPEEPNERTSRLAMAYQRWTYSYMNTILDKGSRQMLKNGTNLCQDDLFDVPPTLKSAYLVDKFREFYEREKGSKRRLVNTLLRLAAPTFIPAGFCQLLTVVAQVAIPLLVRQLLLVLENNPNQRVIKEGIPYAILIFLASILNAFGNHRHRHLATKTGVVLRAAVVNVIYDNALNLTPAGRVGLTSGEVTNLVAVDTQKLFEVTQEGHLIWSCPLSMMLVTVFLILIMGPTTIVGMLVLLMFVPLIQKIASRMLAIRRERVKISDARVDIVNAMLQGIKVTKLNNYESKYQQRILDMRNREIRMLRKELFVWAITLVITVTTPVLASAATFATYVLVSEDNVLTAARTFTVLLLFSALRFPINYTGRLIGRAAQAWESSRRISEFLSRETRHLGDRCFQSSVGKSDDDDVDGEQHNPVALHVERSTFSVGGQVCLRESAEKLDGQKSLSEIPEDQFQSGFCVRDISFSLKPGQILAVVGPVGSGKSTLINGIIGEVPSSIGSSVSKNGRVAYASQVPFILNATLRENILFGLPFVQDKYDAVLDACCLRPDIKQLGTSGDLTEIGERGVTLSGGQKQRVSLARVAYAQPDIVLCDDPLSALDASTAKKIFGQLFKASDNTLLASSAIILVTHAAYILNRVDQILVMVGGRTMFRGSWNELLEYHSEDDNTMVAVDSIRSAVQEKDDQVVDDDGSIQCKTDVQQDQIAENIETTNIPNDGTLMTTETREHGIASLRTWLLWFKHAGGLSFFLIQVLLMSLDRFAYVATEFWLALWTKGYDEPVHVFGITFPAQSEGRSAQYDYLMVYSIILAMSLICTFLRSEWAVSGGARCSKNVFETMLSCVLRAPMCYFETTPLGRILNRFTYDMEVVDLTLTEAMSVLMIATSWFVAGICIMCIILPWIVLAITPVTIMYGALLLHYRKCGADLQRLDAVSRSPIQAMLAEGLDGAPTIRVFKKESSFIAKFQAAADLNSSALMNFITAQRWLGVRIELLGSSVVLVACTLVLSLNDVLCLNAGLVALLIIWASNFTITLGFLVDSVTESEAAITSIERVNAMSRLPAEKPMETAPTIHLPASWPDRGLVQFQGVSLRYRDGLPLSLDGLSFTITPGERCGVVGRTGAGKSTLTVALFRLVEIESGRMLVDGVDVSTLGLADVRGRLSIIPQDPFLLPGTLRECLDPFGSAQDSEILEALSAVRLAGVEPDYRVLNSVVDEGGSNFSVGERQLLCLARALLAKPKVLVMDEATASVDGETDAFIQRMLRTRFKSTTLLTVAHRLNTIMDYDTVLVMKDGKVVESGMPAELLERNGAFADLVASTGDESARALRQMAQRRVELPIIS